MGHTARVEEQRAAATPPPPATGLLAAMERARLNQQFAGGEQIELTDAVLPSPIVDELPIGENIELTGTSDDLTPFARNQLRAAGMTDDQIAGMTAAQVAAVQASLGAGQVEQVDVTGVDLFGGALAPEGAFPTSQQAPAADQTPAPRNPNQRALDFNAPPPTWKQALARQLGLKPQHFRGAAWDRFTAIVGDAQPFTPEGDAAIRRALPEIAGDPASAPLFAAQLAEQYAETEPTATPRTLADALAMTEDEYIRAVNPTGATSAEDDLVIVRQGDLDLPANTTAVEQFQDRTGSTVEVRSDSAGNMYAVRGGEVLGQVSPGDTDTIVNVVQEAQGQGIGAGLMTAFVRANPFAQAGSFSPAGEATRRAAFRRLQQEQAAASVVEESVAPAQPATPGSPGEGTLEAAQTAVTGAEITEDIGQLMNREAAEQDAAPAVAPAVAPPAPTDPIERTIQAFMRDDPSLDRQQAAADAFGDLLMDAPSSDVIDEYFIAIKAHPDWNNLSDAQRNQLVNDFDLRYTELENGTARFDRAETKPKTALGAGVFIRSVRAANANRPAGSPEVVAMDNVPLFEATTGHAAPPDARGVYVDGKVYLIRENIGSTKELATVLAHERGHAGLEALLGSRMTAVTNRLWTNAATRKRIQAKMQQLEGNTDPQQGGLRRLAAEEVLADMLANGEQVNGDIITKARSAIEDSFARLLGLSELRMTNSEVDAILRDAAAISRGTSPTAIDMSKSHLQGLEYAIGDPATFVAGDPRFSRAIADINEIITAASNEDVGTRVNLSEIARRTGLDALQKIKSIGTATAADKARAFTLDMVPLNQLANLYDRLFDGALSVFSRTKRLKEASLNKTITQKTELKYGEQSVGAVSPMDTANKIKSFGYRAPAKYEAWNQLQQTATLYRLWPDRTWEQQSDIDYTAAGYTEAERRQVYNEVRQLWQAVGQEGQQLYKETQAIYSKLWERRYVALRNELARLHRVEGRTDAEYLASPEYRQNYGNMIDAAMGRLSTGPYSPLQRYGDYLITVKDQNGKVAWFSGHDTIEEANKVRLELQAGQFAGADYNVSMPTLRREQNWELDGISHSTIQRLEAAVDAVVSEANDPQLHKSLRDTLVDTYLSTLPSGSFHQHANQRKNVRGATTNAFRAFSDYSLKAARRISELQYNGLISSQLAELQTKAVEKANDKDGILRQRVVEAVKRQHAASLKAERSAVADALSQAGFLWFMSSPSQLIINSMQTPMVTLPRLAGAYGSGPALRQLRAALVDFTKSRGDLLGANSVLPENSVERRVLQELYERGTLDFTLSHDMSALANGETGASMSGHWRKVLEVGGIFMNKSEVFNRQLVALATARLEMEKRGGGTLSEADFQAVADAADQATLTTQFDYSQSNKATLIQGPWRKLIFQFQQYRLNMLAMIGKDIRDSISGTPEEKQTARRALAWMLGVQLALTGAAGAVLAPMAFFIADLFRDDDDLLDSRTEFVQAMPQLLAHGLLADVIDLSRVDMAGLVTFGGQYAPAEASAKETFNYYVMQNLGPWAGLGANIFTGIEKAMEGDHVAAVKNLAPSGIGGLYKAVFESQQGAKDARQIVYFDPSPWDTVLGAMGLRSGDRREAENLRGATYEATMRAQALRSRYLGRLALGYSTGDQDMIDAANESINGWNSRYPDMAIGASDIKRAIVNRVRSQANASMFGVGGARLPSQSIQQAVGVRPE
ncbi:MAG: PLxRFG domain-containing protein [Propionivibrio sp.]|nr:PLxRFG domain-containing protein [Propionivibrio sp.]